MDYFMLSQEKSWST
jgi:solute carrier family 8 (sodium/calcium exchanger)